MSSYLNVYLVPKKCENIKEPEPLLLTSYSRSSDVYQTIKDNVNVCYIVDKDNNRQYTQLTEDDLKQCINNVISDIESTKRRLNIYVEAHKKLVEGKSNLEEAIEEYTSTQVYIQSLESTLSFLEDMRSLLYDEYSDFEKVLVNID